MRYFRFKAITLSVLIVLSLAFVNSGLMNVAFAENVGVDKDKSETFCARSLADGNPDSPIRYGTPTSRPVIRGGGERTTPGTGRN